MALPCTERYAAFNLVKETRIGQKHIRSQYAHVKVFVSQLLQEREKNYLSTSGIANGSYNSSLCSMVGTDIPDRS